MAPRRIVETEWHLHWTFKRRTAQLRLARVTLAPECWQGTCRLSRDVCYVRFFPKGVMGYSFIEHSRIEPDPHLLSFQAFKTETLEEIERRFQAHLAERALTGKTKGVEWVRAGTPCERCPPSVGTRIKLFDDMRTAALERRFPIAVQID